MTFRFALLTSLAGLTLAAAGSASALAASIALPQFSSHSLVTTVQEKGIRGGGGGGGGPAPSISGGGSGSVGGGGSARSFGGGGGGSVLRERGASGRGEGGASVSSGRQHDGGKWRRGDRSGRHAHRHHRHRGGSVGIYIGPGYGYYDYGYVDGECAWLYRRAVRTGSRYWWRRYRDCID